MFNRLKKYFITGLVVLLPVIVTIYIIFVVFRFADSILGKYINLYLERSFGIYIPGLGLVISIALIILVGFLVTRLFLKKFFHSIEKLVLRLPLVKKIYPAVKQIVNFLLKRENQSLFKKVAMVEYPRKGIWSIGFVTSEGLKEAKDKTGQDLLNVFIPNSPTPISGYFMLIPRNDVVFLDMSVEDGIKLLVSGGVLNP